MASFKNRPKSKNVEDRVGEKPDAIRDTLRQLPALQTLLDAGPAMLGLTKPVKLEYKTGGAGLTEAEKSYKPPVAGLVMPRLPGAVQTGRMVPQEVYTLDKDGKVVVTTKQVPEYREVNSSRANFVASTKTTSRKLTEDEVLAYTILGEAGGEGKAGMAAVMQVIKNRAESGRYPSDLAAVALQQSSRGVYQFTTWSKKNGNDPVGSYSRNSTAFKEALAIVQAIKSGAVPDITGGALNYYANKGTNAIKQPWWFSGEAVAGAVQFGNHIFAAKGTPAKAKNYEVQLEAAMKGTAYPAVMSPTTSQKRTAYRIDYLPASRSDLRLFSATPQGPTRSRGKAGAAMRRLALDQGASGLVTRTVNTVPINPVTGQPTGSYEAAVRQATVRAAVARAAANAGTGRAANAAIRDQKAEQVLVRQTPASSTTPTNKTGRSNVIVETVHPDGTTTRQDRPGAVALPADARPSILPKLPVPNLRLPQAPTPASAVRAGAQTVTQSVTSTGYTTKLITKTIQVKNPNYRPGTINPAAVQKLQDIHDRRESGVMAAQGIPNLLSEPEFLTKQIVVEQRVPILIKKPVEIVVSGGTMAIPPVPQPRPVVQPVARTVVDSLRDQGYSPSAAYDEANRAARAAASESIGGSSSSGNSSGNLGGVSSSGRRYDYDNNEWV